MWRGFLFIFASMKAKAFAIGLFLLSLAACRPSTKVVEPAETPSPELLTIDSLMWQQPDSALACLVSCFDACTTTEYNRHYANLLLSELLYKNDYAQTNRPALRQAVAYFDSLVGEAPPLQRGAGGFPPLKGGKGDSKHKPISNNDHFFLAARAHYINGVGYYENDSAVQACTEYLKALEIMEGRFEEKELIKEKANFMAMTYTRLTVIFSKLYLNKQAIYFGKLSLSYYERNKTSPWHLPWMLSKIGVHYNLMDELDSADYYYQQAKVFLPDTVNQTHRDLVARQALLSYQMEHLPAKPIMVLHRIADLAVSDDERLSRYLSIADIYYNERLFDSAKIYFEQVYCNTKIPDNKMLAGDRLRDISMAEGDTTKAKEYALAHTQFVTEKDEDGKLKSNLTTLCQHHEQSRQEALHRLKTQKAAMRWGIALVLAAFVVSVVSLLLVILRRRMRTEQYSHKMEQAALSGRLKRSNEELRELKGQISQQEKNKTVPKVESAATFAEEPICRQILSVCSDKSNPIKSTIPVSSYADIALTDAQKAQLKEATMRHYDPLFGKLKHQYPELKEKDFLYCQLCLLGLDNAQIAVLLQNTISTVWERENRLKRIFGTVDKVSVFLFGFMKN
jgi:tetratricopeptide (TPR) repeat protein